MILKEGEQAPEFCLNDQKEQRVCLSDYEGKWLLIYFYPKDDTPGCTKEACGMRDNLTNFNHIGLNVVGISKDNTTSHKKFAEKYHLNFPLLADINQEVNKMYGVWKPKVFMGREFMGTQRSSFLINPEGKIAKIYENVKPEGHAFQVLEDIQSLKNPYNKKDNV